MTILGKIGWALLILSGIGSAAGTGFITVDTSNKILGKFVDDTNEEINKLRGGDNDEES